MDNSRLEEIWLEAPDGQLLCALTNGDVGWLMYLRKRGDTGLTSRNPHYSGPENATIGYMLGNGQHDEYPASWALPLTDIQHALEYFREHDRPPSFVTWNDDSGDA